MELFRLCTITRTPGLTDMQGMHVIQLWGLLYAGVSVRGRDTLPCLHAGEKLASLVVGRDQAVLGWFMCRRAVWMIPSLRDRAVCEALPPCLERLQPKFRNRQDLLLHISRLICHWCWRLTRLSILICTQASQTLSIAVPIGMSRGIQACFTS